MFNLSLTACSFFLQKTNSKKATDIYCLNRPIIVDDTTDVKIDVAELFDLFFQSCTELKTDDNKQQSFSCELDSEQNFDTGDYKMICARMLSGIYGSSSDIIDGETHKIKYKKKATDIETRPFYVFVVIPKDSDKVTVQKGILIFQNVGPFGIKTITTEHMQAFFSEKFKISLKCRTIAPELFVKKVVKRDSIKKLIMVKNLKSSDDADNFSSGYGKEVREIAKLTFSEPLWDRMMDKIRWVAGSRDNLFEFEDRKYDTLKVEVDIGGRTRKIDLHNIENLSIIEAIPDDIRMDNGHPNKEKLVGHIQKVTAEYLSEMVLQIC